MNKKLHPYVLILMPLVCGLLAWGIVSNAIHAQAAGGAYYVKVGGSGSGDCSNWDNACDLQAALTQADAGDEIWVAAGTYTPTEPAGREATFALKTGVKIYGGFPEDGGTWEQRDWKGNETILSGDIGTEGDNADNSYHVVTAVGVAETALLDGFTITGGNANGAADNQKRGGGIYNVSGSPSLANLTISDNSAERHGGGVYNESGSPSLKDMTVSGNSANQWGGGFYNISGSPSLKDVKVSGNSAGHNGGGIFNFSGNPSLQDVTVSENEAKFSGGGFYNNGGDSSLDNVTISDNVAKQQHGGGFYNAAGNPSLVDVVISGNTADYGGGICNASGNPSLDNVTIGDNSANYDGGGIYIPFGSPSLDNVTISDNKANYGGGMFTKNCNPTLIDVTIRENSATFNGGGIYNESHNLNLRDVIISDNNAYNGGGIYNHKANPSLSGLTISGNSATYNGGGFFNYYGSPSLRDVTISNNEAKHHGGGLSNYGGSTRLMDVTIRDNEAINGGGIYNYNSSPSLENVTIAGNLAEQQGGGMFNSSGDPSLVNVTISANKAIQINGGGIYINSGSPSLINVTISGNEAETGNGGGIYNESVSPTVINGILWANTPDQIYNDEGTITVTYSVIQGASVYPGEGNLNTDPKLKSLADNGGLTLTHALAAGSSAIDRGNNVVCPETDQRGIPRPIDGDGDGMAVCDMGAYEFDPDERSLTVIIKPEGAGMVQLDHPRPYYLGDTITLTALPKVGWVFRYWKVEVEGEAAYKAFDSQVEITLTDHTTVTAYFFEEDADTYKLTVNIDPDDTAGSVVADHPGDYYAGEEVTLTALPNVGWSFSHWNDDPNSTDEVLEVTINDNTTVTAHFKRDFIQIFLPLIRR